MGPMALVSHAARPDSRSMNSVLVPTTELEPDACWRLLRRADVGRLAVIIGERPEIFPVNYAVDGGTVVFRTAPGAKLTAVVSAPAVAFEVDGFDEGADEAWSVVVKGRADIVHGFVQMLDTTAVPVFPWQATTKSQFVRIMADEVTGRQFRKVHPSFWESPLSGARPQRPR